MIRPATPQDIPAIGKMVAELHGLMPAAPEVDGATVARTLAALHARPDGLLLVAGDTPAGFLAASIGYSTVSLAPIAMEHGWYARSGSGGAGLRLLIAYERWAEEQGCRYIRMSTPSNNERAAQILEKRGFFVSEMAWVRAL